MATFDQHTQSGGATSRAFSIPSFTTDEIKVRVDNVLKTVTTHYTIDNYTVNGGTVTWTSGNVPANGSIIRIYRDTKILNNAGSDVEGKATYQAGSSIKQDDLNDNQKQVLRALEEKDDQFIQTYDIEPDSVTTAKIKANNITTALIADEQVTYAKIQNVSATDRILGRDSSGAGVVEEITPAALRTMINVEDGSTADQTGAQIKSAYEGESNTNAYTDAEKSKLAGISNSANNYSISSDLLDEDNMASNSATKAASQQSIKAYVDANSANQNAFSNVAVSGQTTVAADSVTDTLTLAGGSNVTITTNAGTDTVTIASSGGEVTVQDEGSSLSTAATTLNFVGAGVSAAGSGATKTITISGSGGGAITTDFQFLELKAHNNASGAFSAGAHDYELVTKGTNTAVSPTQAAALLISIGGVIQQPQPNQGDIGAAGNGSDGFALDGSSIHFGANLTAHPEYILYLKGSGVATTVGDNTVSAGKTDISIVSGDIIYGNGTDSWTRLAKGSDGEVLKLASGVPSWAADAGGMSNIVEDTSPQLGGALDVQAQEINTSTTNGNIKLTPNGTGLLEVKGNTNPGTIQLNCENNSHGVKIKGPAHSAAASYTLTLPNDDGSANEVLKTDGSGNLDWVAQSVGTITALNNQAANRLTTIGSTTTQLDGEANLTFDGSTLAVTGAATVSTTLGVTGIATVTSQTISRGYESPATVSADWSIGANNNAMFPGPMTVASGVSVTVPANRTLTII